MHTPSNPHAPPDLHAPLSPDERQRAILALLIERPRLTVGELSGRFSTSEDSIRRDLRALAAEGRIRRVHGAVLPAAPGPTAYPLRQASGARAKTAIARAAVARLRDGMTLMLDGGSTTEAIAAAIPRTAALTVVTPSLPVAIALADHPSVETVVLGGRLDASSRATVGAETLARIREINADLCLIAACSIDNVVGLTTVGYEEARIKRAMIASSTDTLAVATADKLATTAAHLIAPLEAVSAILTDSALTAVQRQLFAEARVDIIVAED